MKTKILFATKNPGKYAKFVTVDGTYVYDVMYMI